jgi:hypothetical protein
MCYDTPKRSEFFRDFCISLNGRKIAVKGAANTEATSSRALSFAVFMARKSGRRAQPLISTYGAHTLPKEIRRLYETAIPDSRPELRLAQLCLIRCTYLHDEMAEIQKSAPEASAMVARSIIETALVGSDLALGTDGNSARLMKNLAGAAGRLRDRFLAGDQIAALSLLSEMEFLSEPLDPKLNDVPKALDLRSVCKRLDKAPPFNQGRLASLLYDESYSVLSNHVIHPTPQSLRRHASDRIRPRFILYRNPWTRSRLGKAMRTVFYRPERIDYEGIGWVATAALIGLMSALARGLGEPNVEIDRGVTDIERLDGYFWSGSPARMIAVSQLARSAGLPSLRSLNIAGAITRFFAITDAFRGLTEDEQLLGACEILDYSRDWRRLVCLFSSRARHLYWPGPDSQSDQISRQPTSENIQIQIAALALVYAALWPDDSATVASRVEAFMRDAPHSPDVIHRLMTSTPPGGARYVLQRFRDQIARMP